MTQSLAGLAKTTTIPTSDGPAKSTTFSKMRLIANKFHECPGTTFLSRSADWLLVTWRSTSFNAGTSAPTTRPFCSKSNPFDGTIRERVLTCDWSSYLPGKEENSSCTVQLIRTLAEWSGGPCVEQSLYAAHIQAIAAAQHYIYIENQYLSSSLAGGGVENQVSAFHLRSGCAEPQTLCLRLATCCS